jgi:hypothetical protein
MAINLVCVPIIYLFYPETKNRSLEDMDVLFGGGRLSAVVDHEAARNANGSGSDAGVSDGKEPSAGTAELPKLR